ncbi:MAG: nucleotidyl transferase AbiEii/AbiGii toxin family protein [Desulfobacterales bacterium]|nr:nucleotidyl transferase AbiEii/AbiGii toxin family protein [Desulfobacterales bacterium]
MTGISFNLSGKLDSSLTQALCDVKLAADSLDIPFFVIGATARDIVLEHCHAIRSPRATRDLDIAVEVAGWNEFKKLTEALIVSGGFSATGQLHKLRSATYELDIVPFGPISQDKRSIRWPPDNSVIMNIMGFHEAFSHAHLIRIADDPPMDVHVPTIPGIVILKLISWHDNYPLRAKDAEDLRFFIEHYAEAGNELRLFDEEPGLMREEDFDLTLASIRLLGRDMASMSSEAMITEILTILERETGEQKHYHLVQDMIAGAKAFGKFDETLAKVEKMKKGFTEYALAENRTNKSPKMALE